MKKYEVNINIIKFGEEFIQNIDKYILKIFNITNINTSNLPRLENSFIQILPRNREENNNVNYSSKEHF